MREVGGLINEPEFLESLKVPDSHLKSMFDGKEAS